MNDSPGGHIGVPTRDLVELLDGEDLLLGYQQRLLQTTARYQVTVGEKSRRIGFTWGIGADAVLTAAADRTAAGMDVFYVAYEKEMTREFVEVCAAWAALFNKAASEPEEFVFDGDGDKQIMAFRIRFASGFEIVALSSKPRGLRGRQGYIIIDEAAYHDDLPGLMKAAIAHLMHGGRVLVISTHNGADNYYNQLVEDARAGKRGMGFVRCTLDDAIADGLYRRIALVKGWDPSPAAERRWRDAIVASYDDDADEELFCIPSQSAGSWIAPELLVAAAHPDAGRPELYSGRGTFIGNDIARRGHQWVSTAVELVGDVRWVREEKILRDQSFAVQDDVLDTMFADYRVVRAAMDQTGMGEKPVEDAKRRHGGLRIEGVLFSGDRPLNVATAARQMFEDSLVRLPDDPDLRAEVRSIKRVVGPTGAPRLQTGADGKNHADRAWALFLALAASELGAADYVYHRVQARKPFDGQRGDADDDGTFADQREAMSLRGQLRGGAF